MAKISAKAAFTLGRDGNGHPVRERKTVRDIAMQAELDRLRDSRKRDPPVLTYEYPRPMGVVDPHDRERMRAQRREHRIRHLETRLGMARGGMEQSWEQS